MEEGKLNYKVILDNSALQAQAEESRDILRGIGRTATQEGDLMEGAMKKIGAAMAGAFAVGQLKDFALKVATVRGEFQQLEIAFSTMLGNKQQADALMQQLIDTAATTPFGMNDIANSAKQLLAYGAEADKVNETLVRLGDIAAGLSIPINDLAYLYGTTMVQGRLYTQDLNQFLNRGIPLVDELAKQFGVTKGEVKQLVEQGKVGFPEVEKAIVAMTSEGSKFGGLMEAQSKSITGQISNLEDAVEQMINEVGKSSEGVIGGILGAASSIVDHWKQIGIVVGGTIATWGAYKAAVLAVGVATKISAAIQESAAYQQRLAAMQGIALSEAQAVAAANTNLLSVAMNGLKTAILSNPIGLIVGVIGAAVTALTLFNSGMEETTELSARFGKKAADAVEEVEFLSTALKGLDDSSTTYKKTLGELNTILEEYGLAKLQEGASIDEVNKKREQAIELIKQEGIEQQRLNGIQTANDQFSDTEKNANEELEKRLRNASYDPKHGADAEVMLKELNENSKVVAMIVADAVREHGNLIANKTGEEFEKGQQELKKLIKDRLKSSGFSYLVTDNDWHEGFFRTDILDGYIDAMKDASSERQRFIDITNKDADAQKRAAEAHTTFAERVSAGQRKMLNAHSSAQELYESIKKIYEEFKQTDLNFKINFDAEVPAWMKTMDINELKRLGTYFATLAVEMRKSGKQSIKIGNTTYTQNQAAQQSVFYLKAHSGAQKEKDEAKERAKERAKEQKKAAEDRRKKAQTDAKNRAAEALRERERIAREKFDRQQLIKQYNEKRKEEEAQGELDLAQRRIEAMDEGFEKERAQLALNARRMEEEVKKLRKSMLEQLADNKVNEWLNLHPKATKEQTTNYRNSLLDENSETKLTDKDLSEVQRAQLEARTQLNKEIEEKAQAHLLEGLKERFQDYEAKRTAITKKAAEDRAAINKSTASEDEKKRMLKVLEEQEKKQTKEIYDQEAEAAQQSSDLLVRLFEDASTKSRKQLRDIVTETEQLLAYLKTAKKEDLSPKFGFSTDQLVALQESPEKLKSLTDALKRLKQEVEGKDPFSKLLKTIRKVNEVGNNLDLTEKMQKIAEAAVPAIGAVKGLTSQFAEAARAAGSDELASQAEGVGGVLQGVSNIAQGFAQGGYVGAAIAAVGEGLKVVTSAFEAAARHKQALLEIQKEINDQQELYNDLLRKEQMEARNMDSIFGSSKQGKALENLKAATELDKEIKGRIKGNFEELKASRQKLAEEGKLDAFFDEESGFVSANGTKYVDISKRMRELFVNNREAEIAGLAQLSIKTGHVKTGAFGWGAGRDTYSGLTTQYKDLVKANGHLNLELAKSIVQTRQFEGDGKKTFEALIKKEEQYEEALKNMEEYLSGIFGNYGDEVINAVVDAFDRGEDAAKAFGETTSKVMQQMVKDMLQASVLQPILKEQAEKVKRAFESGDNNTMLKAAAQATKEIQRAQGRLKETYAQLSDELKKEGVDLTQSEEKTRQASEKGIATASQDSVNELNGRMTAIQGHTFSIAEQTRMLANNSNLILRSVMGIERNTNDLPTRLAAVEAATKAMRNSLDDIALKGVRIKN
jgi:hypothetical protein|nr:MAG TPA: tail tape measure protein [Caudoviricetes sp.]